MKKLSSFFLYLILSFFVGISFTFLITYNVHADNDKCSDPNQINSMSIEDLSTCQNQLEQALNMSVKATKPLESELKSMQKQITGIKNRVSEIEAEVSIKKKNIDQGYKDLAKQEAILNRTIRDFYIRSHYDSPFVTLFSAKSAGEITQILAYQKAAADQDKAIITNIVLSISDLEEKKENLEQEQKKLAVLKTTLDEQSAKLDKVVAGAKAYQANLSGQIAVLSAKQQQLISQRLSALGIPRSAGTSTRGCSDDREIDPGFSPRIAFFTYGAPHRNGLNQYGAWGRAKAGQNEEQILQEYYPGKTLKKDYDQGISIKTTTGWSGSIEDYVKRIYEVPDSWTDNNFSVLKAQAVAARSYALNVTGNGANAICTTEQCQVFKPEPKGGNWEQAVEATKGWVLMDGESPAFTQYASTHGGYIQNLGKFDGNTGTPSNFGELNARAYDKESPWFYCDWGARGDKKTAWLRPEEVADIVNIILLARSDSGTKDHLYQTDKPHPYGGEIWNSDRVKSELRSKSITPYDSITDISVNADFGSGKISSVNVPGQSFSGSEFKDWFNLRAPANLQIVGPLYNVERK